MSNKLTLVKSQQFEPHYIEELGCEGLWSDEIAASIEVRPTEIIHAFRYKLENYAREEQLNFSSVTLLLNKPGRPTVSYAFCTEIAKMIVATYKSKKGFAYLSFLLKCERIVLEELPKLIEKTKLLEAKNQILALENHGWKQKEQIRLLKKELRKQNKLMLAPQETLPGMDKPIKYVLRPEKELTELEKKTGKIRHLKRVKEGVDDALNKEEDDLYN